MLYFAFVSLYACLSAGRLKKSCQRILLDGWDVTSNDCVDFVIDLDYKVDTGNF